MSFGGVLVLDGKFRAALEIVRVLGAQGVRVAVGADEPLAAAGHSRFVAARFQYPSYTSSPRAARETVLEQIIKFQPSIVMPVDDSSWRLCYHLRDLLPDGVALAPNPGHELFEKLNHKASLAEVARKFGVPTPRVWQPDPNAPDLPYPVLLKPCRSTGGAGVGLIEDRQQLLAAIETPGETLLQEFIDGDDVTLTLLADRGEVVAVSASRVLRPYPAPYGPSARSVTIADEGLEQSGVKLLEGLGYHGIANLDFRRCHTTGVSYLVDFNARFGGTTAIAVAAGGDVITMLYDIANGQPYERLPRPQVGLEYSWLYYGELLSYAEAKDWKGALWRLARLPRVETNFTWSDPRPHPVQFFAGLRNRILGLRRSDDMVS